jgi:hypothetical protein
VGSILSGTSNAGALLSVGNAAVSVLTCTSASVVPPGALGTGTDGSLGGITQLEGNLVIYRRGRNNGGGRSMRH